MDYRIASARQWRRALAATLSAGALAAAVALVSMPNIALAQQPAKPADKKPAAKPAAPAAQKPAAPAGQASAPAEPQMPQLMYSPWIKVCGNGPNNKKVCITTKDGRLENGMPVAIAQLFEPDGEQKFIRITVPLGMQLKPGTRLLIDQGPPAASPYTICFPVGCVADYPAADDMIAKMKKGQTLILQAVNTQGVPISLPLPLADFAKAHEGPPTDPKVVEEQQRKLQEELQKKAEEARKKLEAQQPAPAAAAPAQKK